MQTLHEKAKKIRLLILDVDGVLTTGALYYSSNNTEMRGFHVHDGLGMILLQKTGVKIAVISAKKNDIVARRLSELKVEYVYQGYEEKLPAYEALKKDLNLSDEQIAYMGDDLPDLPVMRRVGLAITVPSAPAIISQQAGFVTKKKGGKGAVREACEFLMEAQGTFESVLQPYLSQ